MTTKVLSRSPCNCDSCCCAECRGLFGPAEGYRTLSFAHVGIDLTAVQVPATPGGGRPVTFGTALAPSWAGEFDFTFCTLTPQGGTTRNASAIGRRGLDCQVYTRFQLEALISQRNLPTELYGQCYSQWPWGWSGGFGAVTLASGGDVPFAFLPDCTTLPARGTDYVYSAGGPDHYRYQRDFPLGGGGSHYDYLLRQWLENDWLLVVFDGDVAIGTPPANTIYEGIDLSGAANWPTASNLSDVRKSYPIFKKSGLWYARTCRVESLAGKLVFSNARTVSKYTANRTAAFDACNWIDEDGRLRITFAGNPAGGVLTGCAAPYRPNYPTAPTPGVVGVGSPNLPWDGYAETDRKPWLFFGGLMGTNDNFYKRQCYVNGAGQEFDHYDGLYADTDVSVVVPFRSWNPNFPGTGAYANQPLGQGGYKLTPNTEDVFHGLRRCAVADDAPLTATVYGGGGGLASFVMRRLTQEDVEANQNLPLLRRSVAFNPGIPPVPGTFSETPAGGGGDPFLGSQTPTRPFACRSHGWEAWIGDGPDGAKVLLYARDDYPLPGDTATATAGVYYYEYRLAWYKVGTDGLWRDVQSTTPLTQSAPLSVLSCDPVTIRKDVLGKKSDIMGGSDTAFVGVVFTQAGDSPLTPPASMNEWGFTAIGTLRQSSTFGIVALSPPSESAKLVLATVDGSPKWLTFGYSGVLTDTYGTTSAGLSNGSHTLSLPLVSGFNIRYAVTDCGGNVRYTLGNPVTFTVADCYPRIEFTVSTSPQGLPADELLTPAACTDPLVSVPPCAHTTAMMFAAAPDISSEPMPDFVHIDPAGWTPFDPASEVQTA